MINFIAGAILGGMLGILVIGLLCANRDDETEWKKEGK